MIRVHILSVVLRWLLLTSAALPCLVGDPQVSNVRAEQRAGLKAAKVIL